MGYPASAVCPECGSWYPLARGYCGHCGPEGHVKCPATHKPGEAACVLCRKTPGFVEELK